MRPIGLRMRAPTKQRRFRSVQALTHTGIMLTDEESASTMDVTSSSAKVRPARPARTKLLKIVKSGVKVVPAEGLWAELLHQ